MFDEDPVASRIVASLLGFVGYEAHEVTTAEEACRVVDDLDGAVHLLVCDLRPGARHAAIELLHRHPSLRVLFMAGGNAAGVRKELEAMEPTVFLSKPVGTASLLRAVERALAS